MPPDELAAPIVSGARRDTEPPIGAIVATKPGRAMKLLAILQALRHEACSSDEVLRMNNLPAIEIAGVGGAEIIPKARVHLGQSAFRIDDQCQSGNALQELTRVINS